MRRRPWGGPTQVARVALDRWRHIGRSGRRRPTGSRERSRSPLAGSSQEEIAELRVPHEQLGGGGVAQVLNPRRALERARRAPLAVPRVRNGCGGAEVPPVVGSRRRQGRRTRSAVCTRRAREAPAEASAEPALGDAGRLYRAVVLLVTLHDHGLTFSQVVHRSFGRHLDVGVPARSNFHGLAIYLWDKETRSGRRFWSVAWTLVVSPPDEPLGLIVI